MRRKYRYFVGDFETTVYNGQTSTEVWASAVVEMYTDKVNILHSIDETYNYLVGINDNIIIYYHNLKFDGSFWIDYLLNKLRLTQALEKIGSEEYDVCWKQNNELNNNEFKYSISDMGQWYNIVIKVNNRIIEVRDSLKLLPFSVKEIGKSFRTKHQKLDMNYEGFRYAGCTISEKEREYIANDVLVVKEALEIMFNEGHNKLTIGACCLSEYKALTIDYDAIFPDLYEIPLQAKYRGENNVGSWIHNSYKGGWCYLVKGKENKIYKNGITLDVNSLYPSMMHSESGNKYPTGKPTFWTGNYIPDIAKDNEHYFFVRIKTRFYIKENYLPFIQIKGSFLYKSTEMLETSDIQDKLTGEYSSCYVDFEGEIKDTSVELTLTCTDYYLFLEHYNVIDFQILDGCYFRAQSGIFDDYINKYKYLKLNSEGARRTLAKLFLNNLYGKMAASTDSSFKVAYTKEDESIGFVNVRENEKKPGYIAVGSAITSYARNFTIRAAQKNYHGKGKGFIYADTDSLHMDIDLQDISGIKIHEKDFCCWKCESVWESGFFVRQKTYIEKENIGGEIHYNIKCAGMPDRCKKLFEASMTRMKPDIEDMNQNELRFLETKRTMEDFTYGLEVPGKLLPKRIKGGTLLVNSTYIMRK